MHNFGRGMWRRISDYEKLQAPIISQQSGIEQFIQHLTILKQQKLSEKSLLQKKTRRK